MDHLFLGEVGNLRKAMNILALAGGMLIFCGVVLLKVDVWVHKQTTEVRMFADQMDFENMRYHRTAIELMKNN